MEPALVSLIAASVAFVGSHFAMSHPLRPAMVRLLGEGGFMGVYSLVSLATLGWMALAFRAVSSPYVPFWPGFDDVSWAIGSVLTLIAMVLVVGSLASNPALPAPGAEAAARREPRGVFRVTRHPMMWGFALWAIAHMIAAPTGRTLVVMSAILILALVGAHLQDRKKAVLMGEAWSEWVARTSYWPRVAGLLHIGPIAWISGIALWLILTALHNKLQGLAAGIWRWI